MNAKDRVWTGDGEKTGRIRGQVLNLLRGADSDFPSLLYP